MTRPFAGALVAVFGLTLCPMGAVADTPDPVKLINEQVAAGWKAADIKKPAARASDAEYLRRAFIDLIGRIPTTEECLDFEADRRADKRAQLVKRLLHADEYTPKVQGKPAPKPGGKPGDTLTLLYTTEYAKHWANLWTVWLLSRTGHPVYRDQMSGWIQRELVDGTSHKDFVSKLLTASGKTNDKGAVNFIAQNLGDSNPTQRQRELGHFDAVPITSRVTRLFLGVQTQCTQCHDHPFNKEWVMNDFWGVNAFFRQVTLDGTPTRLGPDNRMMPTAIAQLTLSDDPGLNKTGVVFYENTRNGKMLASNPKFLKDLAQAEKEEPSNKVVPADAKSRREAMAQFVVSHDNFARAYVNRVWGHLFGRGLNKEPTVDDFGSHNEVVHPELLNGLAAAFAAGGYDPKQLLEWVCASDAYSLSHVAVKENADPKFDPYFARMPLKALPPEVLFDALQVATRGWLAEDSLSDAKKKERERWLGRLVQNFGDDEGNEMTFNGTIVQALQMMNGRELNQEIGGKASNPVLEVVKRHARGGVVGVDPVLDELFLMTLSRRPTPDEKGKLKKLMASGAIIPAEPAKPAPKQPKGAKPSARPEPATGGGAVLPTSADDLSFYQDVFWALLNTNEFMLNH